MASSRPPGPSVLVSGSKHRRSSRDITRRDAVAAAAVMTARAGMGAPDASVRRRPISHNNTRKTSCVETTRETAGMSCERRRTHSIGRVAAFGQIL